jgi:hypothetical protein
MRLPVVNVFVKNWAKHRMLPDTGIKVSQQKLQSFPASDPIIKT